MVSERLEVRAHGKKHQNQGIKLIRQLQNVTARVYIAIIRTTLLKFVLESDYKSCCHEDLFTFTRSEL